MYLKRKKRKGQKIGICSKSLQFIFQYIVKPTKELKKETARTFSRAHKFRNTN